MTKSGSFEFFEDYSTSVRNLQPEYYSEIKRILDAEFQVFYEKNGKKPVVLDIGAAGVLPYDITLTEKIIILDLFEKPKNIQLNSCCEWVTGDILSDQIVSTLLKKSKFDFIIMSSLLHHLCDEKNNLMANLIIGFSHCQLLLAKQGKICVFESTCSKKLTKLEDFCYPFYSWILLNLFKFTHVRMVSVEEIISSLSYLGLQTEQISITQPRYIAQMYWRIPAHFLPLRISAIFAYESR